MAIRLVPRESSFDEALEGLAARLARASRRLAGGGSGEDPEDDGSREAVWRLVDRLDTTFLTPFDREDLYRLADALARAEEAIAEAAGRAAEDGAVRAIVESAGKVHEAVRALPSLGQGSAALRGLLREADAGASAAARAIWEADEPPASLVRVVDALREAIRAAAVIVVKGA